MDKFIFLRPYWFFAFIPLFLFFVFYIFKTSKSKTGFEKICDKDLLDALKIKTKSVSIKLKKLLNILIFSLMIFALSGPSIKKENQETFKSKNSIIIALDMSLTMSAKDIKPSRFERAKLKIIDVLKENSDGENALILFTDEAYAITPLTEDGGIIKNILPEIKNDIMPSYKPSSLKSVLEEAFNLLQNNTSEYGNVLVLSDGDNLSINGVKSIVDNYSSLDYNVSFIGVGKENSNELIPNLWGGSFVRDEQNKPIKTSLNEDILRDAAKILNGKYAKISFSNNDINEVIRDKNKYLKSDLKMNFNMDLGVFFIIPILFLMPLLFRRGYFLLIIFCFSFSSVKASFWQDWFLNKDQKAILNLKKGDYKKAEDLAQKIDIKASAAYKNKNYKKAENLFKNIEQSDPKYKFNKANSLALQGKLEESLELFNELIRQNPEFNDAKHNKKVVEELLKQQNKNQNKEQNKDKKDQSQNQKNSQKNNENDNQKKDDKSNKKEKKNKNDKEDKNNDSKNKQNNEEKRNTKSNENQEKESEKPKDINSNEQNDKQSKIPNNENMEQKTDIKPKNELKNLSSRELEKRQAKNQKLNQVKGIDVNFLKEKLKREYIKKKYKAD